jgi:hypothetical protein
MDRDMMQLADILVDWCGADLEQASSRDPVVVAREMVKCFAFTLANCQDAREVLDRIVRNEMAEIRSRFEEEDR